MPGYGQKIQKQSKIVKSVKAQKLKVIRYTPLLHNT